MPTADEYDAAAATTVAIAGDVEQATGMLRLAGRDHGVTGGRLGDMLDEAVTTVVVETGRAVDACHELVAEFRFRAEQCRRYDDVVRQHNQRVVDWYERLSERERTPSGLQRVYVGPKPRLAPPPFEWVDTSLTVRS